MKLIRWLSTKQPQRPPHRRPLATQPRTMLLVRPMVSLAVEKAVVQARGGTPPRSSALPAHSKPQQAKQPHRHPNLADHSVPFRHVQQGQGHVTATATHNINYGSDASSTPTTTRLTLLSHKAPVRLAPSTRPSITHAGAAAVTIGHYGGGMAAGDVADISIAVTPHARLIVNTQGSNRIYKQRQPQGNTISRGHEEPTKEPEDSGGGGSTRLQTKPCISRQHVIVDQNALCVAIPDPVSLLAGCVFEQELVYNLTSAATSQLVAVDWLAAGRLSAGERWQQASCTTRTNVWCEGRRLAVDALALKAGDLCDTPFHAVCTVFLYNMDESVVECFRSVQRALCAPYTRVRTHGNSDETQGAAKYLVEHQLSSNGRAVVGVSDVLQTKLVAVRLAASSNEDIYRILHHCLLPLSPRLGMECYKERIGATRSAPSVVVDPSSLLFIKKPHQDNRSATVPQPAYSQAYWSAYMLADSALPIGSFAHSAGLEAAFQLDLLGDCATFVQSATRNTVQVSIPFLRRSHDLVNVNANDNLDDAPLALEMWKGLDAQAHAQLATNGPACRASLDQGRSLLRLAVHLLVDNASDLTKHRESRITESQQTLLKDIQRAIDASDDEQYGSDATTGSVGHLSTIFGVVTGLFGLPSDDASRLFGYCVARDLVSCAVRLNVLGPLQGQSVLQSAFKSGLFVSRNDIDFDDFASQSVVRAAGCAPTLDAIHACHDTLATRLFRT